MDEVELKPVWSGQIESSFSQKSYFEPYSKIESILFLICSAAKNLKKFLKTRVERLYTYRCNPLHILTLTAHLSYTHCMFINHNFIVSSSIKYQTISVKAFFQTDIFQKFCTLRVGVGVNQSKTDWPISERKGKFNLLIPTFALQQSIVCQKYVLRVWVSRM